VGGGVGIFFRNGWLIACATLGVMLGVVIWDFVAVSRESAKRTPLIIASGWNKSDDSPRIPEWLYNILAIGIFIFLACSTSYFGYRAFGPRQNAEAEVASVKPKKDIEPPTVHELFQHDFKFLSSDGTAETEKRDQNGLLNRTNLEYKIWYDVDSKSRFISIYIPHYIDLYGTLQVLPDSIKGMLDGPISTITLPDRPADKTRVTVIASNGVASRIEVKNPGDYSSVNPNDLMFTGRIFIYFVDDLSLPQLGDLERAYNEKGLSPQFRSQDYVSEKWSQMQMTNK
jgi:hypothetical protein